jgi:hypothetical protein
MVATALSIDWEASKLAVIDDVRSILLPRLSADRRFPDASKLADRFEREVSDWQSKSVDERSFRGVINITNEVAAAKALLGEMAAAELLHYEPPINGTKKTLDFLVIGEQGHCAWIDVKTVAPQWQDDDEAWQRFLDIAAEFPFNARLGVRRDFCGAAISGQAIKARWTFIRRTIEVELKAALIPPAEKGRVWLLFCSDSGAWHPDELEDFADFYRTGKFRDDDWSRNAIARYMMEEKLSFARTLEGFHFLRRRQDELNVELRLAMRGPRLFSP